MNNEDFQKFVKERYEDQVNWYDEKSIWYQKMYSRFQWSVIILSAITPVLVAIASGKTRWLPIVISTLVAIGTTSLKTFKYQENWINYRTTCETLKKEIHFYNTGIGDYKDAENRKSTFVERVEALISRENTMWLTTHRPKTEKVESKK